MAAFDIDDPLAVVSPGGVGFDINCGVRLLRTNLCEKDVQPVKVSTRIHELHDGAFEFRTAPHEFNGIDLRFKFLTIRWLSFR